MLFGAATLGVAAPAEAQWGTAPGTAPSRRDPTKDTAPGPAGDMNQPGMGGYWRRRWRRRRCHWVRNRRGRRMRVCR